VLQNFFKKSVNLQFVNTFEGGASFSRKNTTFTCVPAGQALEKVYAFAGFSW
jgi:hypothetical protein